MFQVKEGVLKMTLNYKEPSLEKMEIDINGKLMINGKEVPISFVKKKDSLEGKFSIKTKEIKIADFKTAVTTKELPGLYLYSLLANLALNFLVVSLN